MSIRVRHCVQCGKCRTYYLAGFSPYGNGAYLVPTVPYLSEEYTLYCSCSSPATASRWMWSDVVSCAVSRVAYRRGYGTPEEVDPLRERDRGWGFDAEKYLNSKSADKTSALPSGNR